MLKMGFFSENKADNFSFYSPLSSTAAVSHNPPLIFNTKDGEVCEVLMLCLERSIHWTEAETSFSKQQQKTVLTKQPYLLGGNRKRKSAEPLRCLRWREAGEGVGVVCLSADTGRGNTLFHEVYFWCQLLCSGLFLCFMLETDEHNGDSNNDSWPLLSGCVVPRTAGE